MLYYLIFHFICGVLAAGINFAYLQKEFWLLAEESYTTDLLASYIVGILCGPISLYAALVVTERAKHGIKFL